MWKILQQKKPDDFVIATGKQYSIKQFVNLVCKEIKLDITWKGKGLREKAFSKDGKVLIESDNRYIRPLDVNTLLGNASKARKKLKWKPTHNINQLIKDMVSAEFKSIN